MGKTKTSLIQVSKIRDAANTLRQFASRYDSEAERLEARGFTELNVLAWSRLEDAITELTAHLKYLVSAGVESESIGLMISRQTEQPNIETEKQKGQQSSTAARAKRKGPKE
jgi:hypothetical protein